MRFGAVKRCQPRGMTSRRQKGDLMSPYFAALGEPTQSIICVPQSPDFDATSFGRRAISDQERAG